MAVRISKDGLDDDPVTDRKKPLGSDSKTFIGNRNDLPVNVLFAVLVKAAPVLVALFGAIDGPVSCLAFFRAVSPLPTLATLFGRERTDIEAEGTVPDIAILMK